MYFSRQAESKAILEHTIVFNYYITGKAARPKIFGGIFSKYVTFE